MNENEINLEKEEPKTDYHKILKDIFGIKDHINYLKHLIHTILSLENLVY